MPPHVPKHVSVDTDLVGEGQLLPTWSALFQVINKLVTERDGEWCGIPAPIPGCGLVLEDRHPKAAIIAALEAIANDKDGEPPTHVCGDDDIGWDVVNTWSVTQKNGVTGQFYILQHEDGRRRHGIIPFLPKRNRFLFGPFETLDAWNIDTECTAMNRLATLLSERMFKAYVLAGMFLETSKRSGLTYIFRRLRPTVVITPHKNASEMRILCCLCLHPLGYYANTFCGAMTPTDDVIAHLLMMRGAEHLFWKRANHHAPHTPESGL